MTRKPIYLTVSLTKHDWFEQNIGRYVIDSINHHLLASNTRKTGLNLVTIK